MRKLRKLLVVALALVMVFGMAISAQAADGTPITTLKAAKGSVTVYTNGGTAEVAFKVATKGTADSFDLVASTSDRGVATIAGSRKELTKAATKPNQANEYTVTYTLDAKANGKATILVKDASNAKKTAKVTVTVKTLAESIVATADSHLLGDDLRIAEGGKLNLGVMVGNATASDKGLTYKSSVKDYKVDAKGNVTAPKYKRNKDGSIDLEKTVSTATITVTSKDKNVTCDFKVYLQPVTGVGKIAFAYDTDATKDVVGKMNKKFSLAMKSNASSDAKTYQLVATNDTYPISDLDIVSSNPAIASVTSTGKVVAHKAGKVKLTAKPKLGNNASATVNVTVTTDYEMLTISNNKGAVLANNKDTSVITLTANDNLSTKAAKFVVKDPETGLKTNNASVSSGKFKAKKAGEYIVEATLAIKNGPTFTVNNTIVAIAPTTKVTIAGEGVDSKGKLPIVVRDYDPECAQVALSATTDGEIKDVAWSSSKPAIAVVDEKGVVTPVKNGTADIVAKALDGSGKSAKVTVTVTTAAFDIMSDKLTYDDATGKRYVFVTAKANATETEVDLAKVIAAYANDTASKKTITYKDGATVVKKIKIGLGEENGKVITALTVDGAYLEVKVVALADEELAKTFKLKSWGEGLELKAGEFGYVPVQCVSAEDKPASVDMTALTYKVKDAKVATVDKKGKVTGKAAGQTAVTVSFKNPYDAKDIITVDYPVFVGEKDATVRTTLDKVFTNVLKEENRDWMGVKVAFDSKKALFTVDILNPDFDVNTLAYDSGLGESAIAAALGLEAGGNKIMSISVIDLQNPDIETAETFITREDVKANDGDLKDLLRHVIGPMVEADGRLANWAGTSYAVAVETADPKNQDKESLRHLTEYTVNVTLKDAKFEELLNSDIESALNDEVLAGALDAAGLTYTYDAASHNVAVKANDASYSIVAVDEGCRAALISSFANVYGKLETLEFDAKLGDITVGRAYSDADGVKDAEKINAILDEFMTKLTSNNILTAADADGITILGKANFRVGSQTYARSFSVTFNLGEEAILSVTNGVLNGESFKNGVEDAFPQGRVDYIESDSTFVVSIYEDELDVTPVGLSAYKGKYDALKSYVVENACVDTDSEATLSMNGKVFTLIKEDYSTSKVNELLAKWNITKLGDLVGKTAYVKVPVKIGNTKMYLSYTIKFDVIEVVQPVEEAEIVEEEITTVEVPDTTDEIPEVVEEETEEEAAPAEEAEEVEATEEAAEEEVAAE